MNVPVIPVFYFKDVLSKITDFRNTDGSHCERVYVLRRKTPQNEIHSYLNVHSGLDMHRCASILIDRLPCCWHKKARP